MSEIIVAGAGHGGIVAAKKLAEAGHSVTVYEKKPKESLGYEQYDAVDSRFFDYAGIDYPEHWKGNPNSLTFVPSGENPRPITLPAEKNANTLTMNRRELIRYLIALAEDAGVKFVYECEVTEALILGNRAVGIKAAGEKIYGDLVIDACGLFSSVRRSLPDFMCVKKDIDKYDLLYTYRAYFKRNDNAEAPETRYNIHLKNDGTVGFCWLIGEDEWCDVLIGRFNKPDDGDILGTLNQLYEENPYMSKDLVRPPIYGTLPLRQPLPVFVADGYAAIGDSACMVSPLKGSGIGLSLMAAQMLADAVEADKEGYYDAESLWNYQFRYFKEAGFDCCRLAVAKNLLPFLTADEVSDFINSGIITTEEISALLNGGVGTIMSRKGISALKEKFKTLGEFASTRKKLIGVGTGVLRFTVLEPLMPNKYDRNDLRKWYNRYEDFFAAVRRQD